MTFLASLLLVYTDGLYRRFDRAVIQTTCILRKNVLMNHCKNRDFLYREVPLKVNIFEILIWLYSENGYVCVVQFQINIGLMLGFRTTISFLSYTSYDVRLGHVSGLLWAKNRLHHYHVCSSVTRSASNGNHLIYAGQDTILTS